MIRSEEESEFWFASTGRKGLANTQQQTLMATLNRRLNFQVDEVEIWRNPVNHKTVVAVRFKNGHILKTPAAGAMTEEFLASCVLVYDLPPKR